MLNRSLPEDIKVIDCVEVADEFNARFDCVSREYMYFFMRRALDVQKMEEACKYLEGKYDFRNICKINVVQHESFVRRIIHAGIYPANSLLFMDNNDSKKPGEHSHADHKVERRPQLLAGSPFDMFYLKVRGSSFLWHQVCSSDLNFRYAA